MRVDQADPVTLATLDHLLALNRARHAPTYAGGLANHLSMALVALTRLGADEARLRTFFDGYTPRLDPAESATQAVSAVDLRTRLTPLASQVGGAAFHGVIRVAYAAMRDEPAEIGAALQAFSSQSPMVQVPTQGSERDLERLAASLADAGLAPPPGVNITARLAEVMARPTFQAVVSALAIDETSLDRVSRFGARLWLTAGDFASLHVLTGAHAIRTLGPHWVDPTVAVRAAAVAGLGCYVLAGCPKIADENDLPLDDWETVRTRALASNDEHLCKLVLSCMDEAASTRDPIYQAVATRVARRGEA